MAENPTNPKRVVGTFRGAERFELMLLLLLASFCGQRWCRVVDLPQQRVFHKHRAQVPAGDEATADEMGAESHYLSHQHGSKDVSQLVNDPHRGVHVCLTQKEGASKLIRHSLFFLFTVDTEQQEHFDPKLCFQKCSKNDFQIFLSGLNFFAFRGLCFGCISNLSWWRR